MGSLTPFPPWWGSDGGDAHDTSDDLLAGIFAFPEKCLVGSLATLSYYMATRHRILYRRLRGRYLARRRPFVYLTVLYRVTVLSLSWWFTHEILACGRDCWGQVWGTAMKYEGQVWGARQVWAKWRQRKGSEDKGAGVQVWNARMNTQHRKRDFI